MLGIAFQLTAPVASGSVETTCDHRVASVAQLTHGLEESPMSDTMQQDQAEIRAVLKAVNNAWTRGHPEGAAPYFHQDVVNVPPGLQDRQIGAQALVESYRDFLRQATIHGYHESEHTVNVWGDTAVASYRYEIYYSLEDKTYHDVGHDLFVFTRQSGQWQAVWRTLVPSTAEE
jgi:uncharacterized protein (TIGR02246 family)